MTHTTTIYSYCPCDTREHQGTLATLISSAGSRIATLLHMFRSSSPPLNTKNAIIKACKGGTDLRTDVLRHRFNSGSLSETDASRRHRSLADVALGGRQGKNLHFEDAKIAKPALQDSFA